MSVLYDMHIGRIPLTLTHITQQTGLMRGGIEDGVELLIRRQLLSETMTTNSMGRSRARLFRLPHALFDRLQASYRT